MSGRSSHPTFRETRPHFCAPACAQLPDLCLARWNSLPLLPGYRALLNSHYAPRALNLLQKVIRFSGCDGKRIPGRSAGSGVAIFWTGSWSSDQVRAHAPAFPQGLKPAVSAVIAARLNRLRKNLKGMAKPERNLPSGAKALFILLALSARLKPCPFKTTAETSFSATCKVVPFQSIALFAGSQDLSVGTLASTPTDHDLSVVTPASTPTDHGGIQASPPAPVGDRQRWPCWRGSRSGAPGRASRAAAAREATPDREYPARAAWPTARAVRLRRSG